MDVEALQETVRRRILSWFRRKGLLEEHTVRKMLGWDHAGGFSLDASVRIDAHDRAGLERLLRYWARAPFALNRIEWQDSRGSDGEGAVLYRLPRPTPDGRTLIRLSPLEFLDRLVALVPPPRVHRHRYHGVLAPFLTDPFSIRDVLDRAPREAWSGEPVRPPPLRPARGPPELDPMPPYEMDQTRSW